MTVVYVLLPLAVLLAVGFLGMFIWATRDGQFDDVRTPQLRVLFDDDVVTQVASPSEGSSAAEPEWKEAGSLAAVHEGRIKKERS